MRKLVYLYELDSVRNSPKEIEAGQNALFEEIALNGNAVVISFNQLIDSHAFLATLDQEKTSDVMMNLFKAGVLKLSLYGDKRTASQYVIESIDKILKSISQEESVKQGTFIFSAFPFTPDKDTWVKIRNAIMYGDIHGVKEDSKNEGKNKEFLIRYVNLIRLLSTSELARNPKKESEGKTFDHFMEEILTNGEDNCSSIPDIMKWFPLTSDILKEARRSIVAISDRSNWRTALSLSLQQKPMESVRLAVAIVDLCYCYTVEDSINNVSKHYDSHDSKTLDGNFWEVFQDRLERYWKDLEVKGHDICVHYRDTHDPKFAYTDVKLPPWKSLNWMMEGFEKREKSVHTDHKVETYEENLEKHGIEWKQLRRSWFCKYLGIAFVYIVIFILISLAVDYISRQFTGTQEHGLLLRGFWASVSILLFGSITCFIHKVISKFSKIPDIIGCFGNIFGALWGFFRIYLIFWWFKRGSAYKHSQQGQRK